MDTTVLEVGRFYTRPQLARLWGYETHHAISKGVVTPAGQNVIVLFVTHVKQASLQQYKDFISGGMLCWEGERRHGSDQRIARAAERGDEIHLFFREIHHTPFEYYGRVFLDSFELRSDKPSEFAFHLEHDLSENDDLRVHEGELVDLAPTERDTVVAARRGQGAFRERLFALWKGCAVCGARNPRVLRASHIKPWRLSSNSERLDLYNGLMLSPTLDHLFDRGFVSFLPSRSMLISEALDAQDVRALQLDSASTLRFLLPEHQAFLEFHRDTVFAAPKRAESSD